MAPSAVHLLAHIDNPRQVSRSIKRAVCVGYLADKAALIVSSFLLSMSYSLYSSLQYSLNIDKMNVSFTGCVSMQ
jgi:hypothetical protein